MQLIDFSASVDSAAADTSTAWLQLGNHFGRATFKAKQRNTSDHVAAMTQIHFHFYCHCQNAFKCALDLVCLLPKLLFRFYIIYSASNAKLCASNCSPVFSLSLKLAGSVLWPFLFCYAFLLQYENYDCIFGFPMLPLVLFCFGSAQFAIALFLQSIHVHCWDQEGTKASCGLGASLSGQPNAEGFHKYNMTKHVYYI